MGTLVGVPLTGQRTTREPAVAFQAFGGNVSGGGVEVYDADDPTWLEHLRAFSMAPNQSGIMVSE